VRVIARKILREFWERHSDAEGQLKAWYKDASNAEWNSPIDIKSAYPKTSILKDGRVVFNICGNKYRLITKINYVRKWVFIRFIGSHDEYNKINANTI
jgi:mRNA interferase HigB